MRERGLQDLVGPGIWGGISGLGVAVGPLVGGYSTSMDWAHTAPTRL